MTFDFKNLKKGITLIEVSITIFFIVLFSLVIIADFPKILRQSALSRATYKLAQDLRSAQDLGLSGIIINDANEEVINVEGYGIYVGALPTEQYVIYADVNGDQKYSGGTSLCSEAEQIGALDCVIEVIDVSKENPSLSIDEVINNSSDNNISSGVNINFKPPNPTINIQDNSEEEIHYPGLGVRIVLKNTDGFARAVSINSSGLIEVQ